MKIKGKFLLVPVLILVLAAGLTGCLPAQKAGLSNQQVASLTESILKALDQNNYQAFVHDFSPQMKSAFPQEKFSLLKTRLHNASGNFLYQGEPGISDNQGYAVYRFPCNYANENVTVTITFVIGGQEVEGLYFDSANLRKASQ